MREVQEEEGTPEPGTSAAAGLPQVDPSQVEKLLQEVCPQQVGVKCSYESKA